MPAVQLVRPVLQAASRVRVVVREASHRPWDKDQVGDERVVFDLVAGSRPDVACLEAFEVPCSAECALDSPVRPSVVVEFHAVDDLATYFTDEGVLCKWLHSELDAFERVELLRDLRQGKFEALVGVNLLREGLDLPGLLATVARHYLERALDEAAGNKTRAAKLVGLPSYQTLTNWMRRYGVTA